VVGAGPTGLMLGAELALGGVDVAVLERRGDRSLAGTRAGGLSARTLEVLAQRGIADRFVACGQPHPVVHVHPVPLSIADFPTRFPFTLSLRQEETERLLDEWVATLPVALLRGVEATRVAQDAEGVDVGLSDGRSLRARYVVGCDGGRSLVRGAAGIAFPGWDASTSWILAEASMTGAPPFGFREDALGQHGIGRVDDAGRVRIVLTERDTRATGEPTPEEVRAALAGIYGSDFGFHAPTWLSRFTDMARQAEAYRAGRLLLAGDAAHVHAPVGGQGLNLGVQDAVNLGWKLAQVVRGISPEALLDTYHAERHPVAARVLRDTMAQVALRRTDDRSKALAELVTEMLSSDEARRAWAGRLSGLSLHHAIGDGHPLVGRRLPDLDLGAGDGTIRAFELLFPARPLLIRLGGGHRHDMTPWADRVRVVEATYAGTWLLPVIGEVPAPESLLVRPDGMVAWAGDRAEAGLEAALERWFAQPPHG